MRYDARIMPMPYSKPDVMYFVPELFDGHAFGTKVHTNDADMCLEMHAIPKRTCCPQFMKLAHILKPDLQPPNDAADGLELYYVLIELCEQCI